MSTILTTKTNSMRFALKLKSIHLPKSKRQTEPNRNYWTKPKLLNRTEPLLKALPPPFQICWVTTSRRKISKQSSYGYGDQSFSPPPRILIICSRIFLPLWRSSRPHGLVTLLFLIRIRVKSAQKFRTKRTLRNLSSLASLFDLVC